MRVYSATAAVGTNAVIMRNLYLMNATSKVTGSGGSLTIKNDMTFPAGRVEGSGTLIIQSGALNMPEPTDKTIIGWGVNNFAATNWTGGNIVTTGNVFTNKLGGVFNLNDFAGNWTATGGSFVNQGTFNSSGAHTMGIEFVSTNQAEVLSGNLTLTQGREFGGTVTIQASSSVTLGAGPFTFNAGLNVSGAGVMIQDGANTTVAAGTVNVNNYELRLGTLDGPGTFNIGGSFTWTGGTMTGSGTTLLVATAPAATIGGAGAKSLVTRTFHNAAFVGYLAGTLTLSNGATLSNAGIFDIRDNVNILNGGGPASTIGNYNEFRKSQVSGESRIDVAFNNASGAIKVQAGTLIFRDTLEFLLANPTLPTLDVAANTECKVQYMNLNVGTITGAGTLSTLPGGTINWYDGTASGSGVIHNVATGLVKVDGPMTLSGFTWTNEGTANWQSGNIQLAGGAIVNNQPGANFRAFNDNEMTGAGIFYNYGNFTKMQGNPANQTRIAVTFNNKKLVGQAASIVTSAGGVISFQATGTHNSQFSAAGGDIEFAGPPSVQTAQTDTLFSGPNNIFLSLLAAINVEGTNVLSTGTFVLGQRVVVFGNPPSGGTLTGAGVFTNTGTVIWEAGSLLNLNELQNNGVLEFRGSGVQSISNSRVTNNVTITWSAGDIRMASGAVIDNRSTAVFDVRADATMSNADGYVTPGLLNAGTLQKTAGGGVTTIQVTFAQTDGSFLLNGRNMTFTRDVLQTGGQTKLNNGVSGGGTLIINGKYNLTNQNSSLSMDEGTVTVDAGLFVQGGTVSNASGTLNGNVSNAGLVLIGGASRISTLFVNGDFTQTADGTLRSEISAPGGGNPVSYDNLHVYGTLTAAGTLDVVALQPFFPAVGNQFQLIGFLARAGDWGILNLPDLPVGRSWKQQKWFENEFTLEVQ